MAVINDVKPVVNAIKAEIKDTDLIVALCDCFYTWDGDVNLDVITQGILARYRAMGINLHYISYRRKGLQRVEVYTQSDYGVEKLIMTAKKGVSPFMVDSEYFHEEERKVLNEFLINNFYHQ